MLRVGLTGGLASGKSTVAAMLAKLGAVVFDADAIVRDLYRPGAAGAEAARELFGSRVLDVAGNVDRARIAEIVFSDPACRHELEGRIHPLVRAEIDRWFREAEAAGARVGVAEASQILEAGSDASYDRILLVTAPLEDRVSRWSAGGGDPDDARRRIAAQLPAEVAAGRAHDVIVNEGTLPELERKVEALYRGWTR